MPSTLVDLCTVPAAIPPDGKPNFTNPTTLAPVTIAIGVILATFSVILTFGRMYMNRRRLCDADYFALAACIINIAFTGDILAQYKFNRHQWDIPVCWFTGGYFKIVFVQITLFAPVFITSKAAIFLLYRQIFAVQRCMRISINLGLFLTFLLYLPNIPIAALYQAPRWGDPWTSMLTSTRPQKIIIWGIIQSAISIVLDLYIFTLPLSTIARLNIPFNRRLQIIGVFATALIGVIASVLSLVYRIRILNKTDDLWWQTITAICALVETNVAIIVSCMPAFAQLLKVHVGGSSIFQSLRLRYLGGSSYNRSGDKSNEERPQLATFGSNQLPRRNDYYELTDTALLKSQITANDELEPSPLASDGINRTVGFSQQYRPDSTEHVHEIRR
ncbi:hypothetical protein LOCC1_G001473 [Lachnellula occidentalis]|uniref:Rhodopsin domain-containing protein n=1 Tax=Lachnellula occidentalis TaxID=215460 RepID=A0A8H8S5F3_9HELO|nr:hypothetical protein LOCC1_G001473 [Lachnellula occidentalis]